MLSCKKIVFAAVVALLLIPCRAALAADDKERVLRQLDAAAVKFHNTTADFQFKSIETDPVYFEEKQEGTVYYERTGSSFQMAGHIEKVDDKPVSKIYTFSNGEFKLYEKKINQITKFNAGSKAEGYAILGFGASGRELEKVWEIKYLGSEMLPDGKKQVKTEMLELVAKDPAVRKNIARVVVWIDPVYAVSLKQIFYESPTQRRECFYFNIKVNEPHLPADVFTIKPEGKPNIVTK